MQVALHTDANTSILIDGHVANTSGHRKGKRGNTGMTGFNIVHNGALFSC